MAANLQLDERENNISDAELAAYREVVNRARQLPVSLRIDLAQAMLGSLRDETSAPKQRNSYRRIAGRMKTNKPAPSDEDVRQMLDEARLERYG